MRTQIFFKVAMAVFFISAHHCNQNCYALEEEVEEERPCSLVTSLKKCLNYIVCIPPIREEEEEQLSYSQVPFIKSGFEALPTELLHKIFYNLSPLTIINLSKTASNIEARIDDCFWKEYLKTHKWEIWDKSLSFKKIAFAHHLFKQGKIDKAAQLNHPKAIKIKRDREEIKEARYEKYKRETYTTRDHFFYMLVKRHGHRIQDHPFLYKGYY